MARATTEICPACQAPRGTGEPICPICGRVFDPGALSTLGPAPAHFAPGQRLGQGRYEVLRPFSQGGMGALYLAADREAFGRSVVVKTLLSHTDALASADAIAGLRRIDQEARTLASLSYPTIPQIYAYFREGPIACMVMEYIAGDDLSRSLSHSDPASGAPIAGRPYPIGDVIAWAVALCRTLEYLSSVQPAVVHQDIKPANLIRDPNSGQLYLVDFGAARATAAAAVGPGTAIFGTPGYAAREQYGGQSGPPSDVYALAATLYHLATDDDPGGHPFAFPQLKRLGYFGRILQGALADDPAQRPSAATLRHSIEAMLQPAAKRALAAPDGTLMQSENELARWCEGHWEQARSWLYATMAEAVERELVRLDLAAQLRAVVARHPDSRDAGLDAALARLDPAGFGAAEPMLQLSPDKLELGRVSPTAPISSLVRVRNTGRRYAHAEIIPPRWLAAGATAALATQAAKAAQRSADPLPWHFDLPPGQEQAVSLACISGREPVSGYHHSDLILRANRQSVARMLVTGSLEPRKADPTAAVAVGVVLLVIFGAIVLATLLNMLAAATGG